MFSSSAFERSRALLGEGVDFRIEIVQDFPEEPGRKFRVLRSLVGAGRTPDVP